MQGKKQPEAEESGAEDNLSFEEALTELEEVVRTLETGNIPLQASLSLLQRGIALATQCDTALAKAESVLEQLTVSADGEIGTERLQWLDDEDEEEDDDEDGD